jgi:prophage regulatory protein
MATPTTTSFIRVRDVRARAGITRSTIYRLMQRGEFPRCIKLAPNVSVWSSHEIDEWIAARIAQRDGTPPGGAA